MDPLSQGTVGAAFAQSTANKDNLLKIGVIGFLAAGMKAFSPDT